jgi:hypothetical protein
MGKVEDATATMIQNLEAKTGKSLAIWVALLKAEPLAKHSAMLAFLKSKHGLGHGYANLVARSAMGGASASPSDDSVAAQYAGAKAALRPIYDDILAAVREFGGDVEVAPKKAYVSFRRNKQFAIVQPSTATRLDVGLNLRSTAAGGRLELSESFNSMVSHRVRLDSRKGVDRELIGWLK